MKSQTVMTLHDAYARRRRLIERKAVLNRQLDEIDEYVRAQDAEIARLEGRS